MDHLAITVQSFVAFCVAITKLLDFILKLGQNLHANIKGFRRDSQILGFYGYLNRCFETYCL